MKCGISFASVLPERRPGRISILAVQPFRYEGLWVSSLSGVQAYSTTQAQVAPMMTDDGAEGKVANTNVASDEMSAANTGSSAGASATRASSWIEMGGLPCGDDGAL